MNEEKERERETGNMRRSSSSLDSVTVPTRLAQKAAKAKLKRMLCVGPIIVPMSNGGGGFLWFFCQRKREKNDSRTWIPIGNKFKGEGGKNDFTFTLLLLGPNPDSDVDTYGA